MKKLVVSLLLILFASGWFSQARAYTLRPTAQTLVVTLTKEQWRRDLQYLARELPRRHKNAFHTVSRGAFEEVPLFRQRQAEQFWFTSLPGSQTLYVNLRGYPETSTFKRISDDLLKLVNTSQPKRLVIDARQNTGGDFNKGRYLLAGLKKHETFRNRGSVYVITGRATQSAAMVNAIDFRKELNAILVGEPTGGRPNSYSENDEFRLPNSNLEVSYSNQILQVSRHGYGCGDARQVDRAFLGKLSIRTRPSDGMDSRTALQRIRSPGFLNGLSNKSFSGLPDRNASHQSSCVGS